MKANLETVPKFRITLTRGPGDDSTLPEDLGAERQPDGGWHLWEDSEPFSGITIPAEAVGKLVEVLTRSGVGQAAPSEQAEWSYNAYRATLLRDGEFFAIVTPNGTDALPKERVDILLSALNQTVEPVAAPAKPIIEPDPGFRIVAPGDIIQAGDRWKFRGGDTYPVRGPLIGYPLAPHTSAFILQRPVAPKPTVEPDPGYRRVTSGEISRDGDLWKYSNGDTLPGTPGLIHCDQTCGAILQRLDPGAVAPGHNPDRLTVAQVGIAEGWRLLRAELFTEGQDVRHTEWWNPTTGRWSETGTWMFGKNCTLRTRRPV